MSNLEQAIAEWRRRMANGAVKSADVLDELESHLRDEVEQQVCCGSDPERAFNSAILRMRTTRALRRLSKR